VTLEAIIALIAGAGVVLAGLIVSLSHNAKQRGEIKRLKDKALKDSAERQAESEIDRASKEYLDAIDDIKRIPPGDPTKLARAIEASRAARARAKADLERKYGLQLGSDEDSD
jgi:hypothetical protein